MGFLSLFAALFFALLSGCVSSAPDLKAPPSELPWGPQAPFRGEKKVEIPAEAPVLAHFAKGQSPPYAFGGPLFFDGRGGQGGSRISRSAPPRCKKSGGPSLSGGASP